MRLPIHKEDISKDIAALPDGERIDFIANFAYRSVLDDDYNCQYILSTGRYLGEQSADLKFTKRPWD